MCAACSATDWRMVPTLPAEFEIRRRISRIADSSLASRAASDSWLAADELRGRVVSARLRPFRVAAFRRRDLIDAAPALERRLIALPQGSGQGIMSVQTSTLEAAGGGL